MAVELPEGPARGIIPPATVTAVADHVVPRRADRGVILVVLLGEDDHPQVGRLILEPAFRDRQPLGVHLQAQPGLVAAEIDLVQLEDLLQRLGRIGRILLTVQGDLFVEHDFVLVAICLEEIALCIHIRQDDRVGRHRGQGPIDGNERIFHRTASENGGQKNRQATMAIKATTMNFIIRMMNRPRGLLVQDANRIQRWLQFQPK